MDEQTALRDNVDTRITLIYSTGMVANSQVLGNNFNIFILRLCIYFARVYYISASLTAYMYFHQQTGHC